MAFVILVECYISVLARNAMVLLFVYVYYIHVCDGAVGDGAVGVGIVVVVVAVLLGILMVVVNIKSTINQLPQPHP